MNWRPTSDEETLLKMLNNSLKATLLFRGGTESQAPTSLLCQII